MHPADAFPVGLTRAPLQAFVEVPLATGAPFDSVEVQMLAIGGPDTDRSSGLLVKLQQWSGEVDVYFEPHLGLTEKWFRSDPGFSHIPLGGLFATDLDLLDFSVDARRVQVDVSFTEREGRPVRLGVHHRARIPARPMFVPATPQLESPALRLLYTDSFRLLPRRTSVVNVEIGGRMMAPRPFLMPNRLASHWSARAASGIVMAGCNGSGGASLRVGNDRSWLEVSLEPDPPPARPGPPAAGNGSFSITAPVGTVTAGHWAMEPDGDAYEVTLTRVRQDWFPGWSRPAVIMLWAARRFRRRRRPWTWRGRLHRSGQRWQHDGRWALER